MIYNDVCQTTWDNSTDRIESCRVVFSSDCDVYQTTHGMSKGRLVSMFLVVSIENPQRYIPSKVGRKAVLLYICDSTGE